MQIKREYLKTQSENIIKNKTGINIHIKLEFQKKSRLRQDRKNNVKRELKKKNLKPMKDINSQIKKAQRSKRRIIQRK